MKNQIFSLILSVLMVSCSTKVYFQVYKTDYEGVKKTADGLLFEDKNCSIYYNLWEVNGNIGFLVTNKTENDLYLDLKECFFIRNNIAYDYFQNRVFTDMASTGSTSSIALQSSKSTGLAKTTTGINQFNYLQINTSENSNMITTYGSYGTSFQKGHSTSYQEKDILVIPPHTSKLIQEFSITETRIKHCDLYIYPDKNNIKTVSFSKENSPIVFSNRIVYSIDPDLITKTLIENKFWVTEITNLPYVEMTKKELEMNCGKKTGKLIVYFRDPSPDKFYIIYKMEYEQ
jgi:hypothetical protein